MPHLRKFLIILGTLTCSLPSLHPLLAFTRDPVQEYLGQFALNDTYTGRYDEYVDKGNAALNKDDLIAAERWYKAAAREVLVEVPNFAIFAKLAEVKCKQSDTQIGLRLLSELRCMIEIEAGRMRCYTDDVTHQPNKAVSQLCFERMCSEMYLSYYPTRRKRASPDADPLRVEMDRVTTICNRSKK